MGNIKFASKVHLGVISNIRVAKGTAKSLLWGGANQVDVCYYINLKVDMGVKKGMYNGVQPTQHFNPYELRRESIRTLFG